MSKLNVYLQYPWKSADSTYYKNILDCPPKGIIFLNNYGRTALKREVIGSSKKFESIRRVKNFLRRILGIIKIPNLTYTLDKNCDVIHCAHCLSLNRKPWVVDTEVYDRIAAGYGVADSWLGKKIIKNRLESKYCKKIIVWSQDCKRTFEDAFPNNEKILSKIEIVHFAMQLLNFKKIPHKNIRLLFVARWFDAKGGRTTLEVFNRLTKKYPNVEAMFICPTPQEYKDKYSTNKKIKILDLMPQEKLFKEIYPSSDIFFYPGYGDSYGFALPEAMSFSLPIVTVDSFARREIVKDGKTGFIIPRPKNLTYENCLQEEMLQELVKRTSLLIENTQLRSKMGKAGREEVKSGLFSIEKRNKHLGKLYRESLNL
jgi:glycosyltransferase involved in cell wall biosynthesis